MKLGLASLACGQCGERLMATVPLNVLHLQIGCAYCGAQAVTVEPGHSVLPIPPDSSIAEYWHRNAALEEHGDQWHPC